MISELRSIFCDPQNANLSNSSETPWNEKAVPPKRATAYSAAVPNQVTVRVGWCCMRVVWVLYRYCLRVIWELFGSHLEIISCCVGVVWMLCGCCLGVIWVFFGSLLGIIWVLFGNHLGVILCYFGYVDELRTS